MVVRVLGWRDGVALDRCWTLIAEGGDGPHIPALPARILIARLARGTVSPGLRPALGAFTLDEVREAAAPLAVSFGRSERQAPPLFARTLGPAFATLPPEVRALHDVLHVRRWQGRARIERGGSVLSRLVCAVFRFPRAAPDVPVEVEMESHGESETWIRTFGRDSFRSHLRPRGDRMTERFGLLTFELDLTADDEGLHYPVRRGWALGIPIPRALLPRSETREFARDARVEFDVRLSAPLAGLLVHYRGWLTPADDTTAPGPPPS
ncbi:DUF4166 domain-containing protein [Jannaschia aquimarina]|uniref:DUF4166 domain-containing protein n=1 Tax=Jannaschia aquimarina TaxID=935700 RepID=A0A0D1EG73_9RHOB|nr:DUF4166 domain-containing protein [Jannaschia aquimarina]KIT14815.1 hypothetical protein jaqu_31400 [Jannaschia aquimarina]SNS56758.1 protein of unknown function [Jannaschia aquimarina]